MKDDVLWMGEIEAVVNEVDPIRGLIKVTLANNVQLDVARKRPEPQKSRNLSRNNCMRYKQACEKVVV